MGIPVNGSGRVGPSQSGRSRLSTFASLPGALSAGERIWVADTSHCDCDARDRHPTRYDLGLHRQDFDGASHRAELTVRVNLRNGLGTLLQHDLCATSPRLRRARPTLSRRLRSVIPALIVFDLRRRAVTSSLRSGGPSLSHICCCPRVPACAGMTGTSCLD